MTPGEPVLEYRLSEVERRVDRIEEIHPDVLVERIDVLSRRVTLMVGVGISVLIAFIGAAISFTFMAIKIASGAG